MMAMPATKAMTPPATMAMAVLATKTAVQQKQHQPKRVAARANNGVSEKQWQPKQEW